MGKQDDVLHRIRFWISYLNDCGIIRGALLGIVMNLSIKFEHDNNFIISP